MYSLKFPQLNRPAVTRMFTIMHTYRFPVITTMVESFDYFRSSHYWQSMHTHTRPI